MIDIPSPEEQLAIIRRGADELLVEAELVEKLKREARTRAYPISISRDVPNANAVFDKSEGPARLIAYCAALKAQS